MLALGFWEDVIPDEVIQHIQKKVTEAVKAREPVIEQKVRAAVKSEVPAIKDEVKRTATSAVKPYVYTAIGIGALGAALGIIGIVVARRRA